MIEFGTGGWREIIGDGFTRANVRLLVQGLSDRIVAEGVADRGVVVGYDRRFLSDVAAWWAVEVFLGKPSENTYAPTARLSVPPASPTPTQPADGSWSREAVRKFLYVATPVTVSTAPTVTVPTNITSSTVLMTE